MKKLFAQAMRRHKFYLSALFSTWGLYFIFLFSRILKMKPDGLYGGHENVWSDWSLHIAIANIFAFKEPSEWFAYHPLYAGGKFTYPFLADFISGILMRLGLPLIPSFIFPSVILIFAALAGMYALAHLLLRSEKAAFAAVSFFLLSAGTGFLYFFGDLWRGFPADSPEYLKYPYGRFDEYGWYAGNVIVGLIVPQRAFLLGLALGTWSLAGLIFSLSRPELKAELKKTVLFISGIFAGLLPIAHAHGFIVLVAVAGFICFAFLREWRLLAWYVIPAALVSSSLFFIFIYGGIENPSFVSWLPGYTSKEGISGWLKLWFWLFGVMPLLAVFGWFVSEKNRTAKAFYLGMLAVFTAANLFIFQPIRWDNSKLFFWVYFGFSCLAAAALGWLWKRGGIIMKSSAAALALLLVFTGALNAVKLQQVKRNSYLMTSAEDISLGLEIREKTGPFDVFLTAPVHNHPVMMWGARPILMGYRAWAENFGFLRGYERWEDMKEMFGGGEGAEALFRQYGIRYVAVGPGERRDFSVNERYFASRFPVAFKNSSYFIYDIGSLYGGKNPLPRMP